MQCLIYKKQNFKTHVSNSFYLLELYFKTWMAFLSFIFKSWLPELELSSEDDSDEVVDDDEEVSAEEDSDETERASTSWGTAAFALGCAFKCSLNSSLKNKYVH